MINTPVCPTPSGYGPTGTPLKSRVFLIDWAIFFK